MQQPRINNEEGNMQQDDYYYFCPALFKQVVRDVGTSLNANVETDLETALSNVFQSFRYRAYGGNPPRVDYNLPINQCASFYRYAQLAAELMGSRINEALNGCPEFAEIFKGGEFKGGEFKGGERPTMNVVIVGSGGGADLVGLFNALHGRITCPQMNITLVDIIQGWKAFSSYLVQLLVENEYGVVSAVMRECNANIQFLCQDATVRGPGYLAALKTADVVILPRLLSILPINDDVDRKQLVTNILTANMRDGAFLAVIDTPKYQLSDNHLQEIAVQQPSPAVQLESNIAVQQQSGFNVKGTVGEQYEYGICTSTQAQIYLYKKI